MKKGIWIRNVFYFSKKLLWYCLTFNKKEIADTWDWLKMYFDKEELKRDKENTNEISN